MALFMIGIGQAWLRGVIDRHSPLGHHLFEVAIAHAVAAGYPRVISTDKAPSLARAISELKAEGVCPSTVEHRRVKYLNNVIGQTPSAFSSEIALASEGALSVLITRG